MTKPPVERRRNWIQRQLWRPWLFTAAIFIVAWNIAGSRFAAKPIAFKERSSAVSAVPLAAASRLNSAASVAVLQFDGRDASAAARALRAAGVAYEIVSEPAAARRSRMIVIPLDDQAAPLSDAEATAYSAWVSSGGVLILQSPSGRDLWRPLTGLEKTIPARTRRRITLRPDGDPIAEAFPSAPDRTVILAGPASAVVPWTAGLRPSRGSADVLAVFDDLEPAIIRRRIGSGRVYILGATLTDLYARPLAARHFDASADPRGGAFESGADFAPLLLRAWASSAFPVFVRLRALPGRASAVLCVSHDLPEGSLDESAEVAAAENALGVRAAWFARTGLPGFDARRAAFLREAASLGHEIGSRGEILPPDFNALELGTGNEDERSYSPRIEGGRSFGATLLGEARVSRSRLKLLVGIDAAGFRGPESSRPVLLDSALSRAGYLYDSGLSAAEVLTHHPFFMPAGRGFAEESGLIALPVGMKALKSGAPSPSRVLALLKRVAANEGVLTWDLSPDRTGLAALQGTIERLPAGTVLMTPGAAARRASERARTRFWLEDGTSRQRVLGIAIPEGGAKDLSFEIRGLRSCALLSGGAGASFDCEGDRLIVSAASAGRLFLSLNLK